MGVGGGVESLLVLYNCKVCIDSKYMYIYLCIDIINICCWYICIVN